MLADIVRGVIASETDFQLVDEVGEASALAQVVSAGGVDVLVLGGSLSPARAMHLLYRAPRLKIITIDADGHSGAVHEFRLRRGKLHEISATTLVAAIRSAAEKRDPRATLGEQEA